MRATWHSQSIMSVVRVESLGDPFIAINIDAMKEYELLEQLQASLQSANSEWIDGLHSSKHRKPIGNAHELHRQGIAFGPPQRTDSSPTRRRSR
jgi:hypothetical protein